MTVGDSLYRQIGSKGTQARSIYTLELKPKSSRCSYSATVGHEPYHQKKPLKELELQRSRAPKVAVEKLKPLKESETLEMQKPLKWSEASKRPRLSIYTLSVHRS